MIKAEHIYGTRKRLFLNTELGCTSACKYCYLPSEGFKIGLNRSEQSYRITPETLLDGLYKDQRFVSGSTGTLLSIGCFSEAWDPRNRQNTVSLIRALLPLCNPIQLATKRRVQLHDLREIVNDPAWRNQLRVYISSASITHWAEYEPRTIAPKIRFESFVSCNNAGVQAFLYIKPLIPSITIRDSELYGALMRRHDLAVIVGDQFVASVVGPKSPISNKLFVVQGNESILMRAKLTAYGQVFATTEDALDNLN